MANFSRLVSTLLFALLLSSCGDQSEDSSTISVADAVTPGEASLPRAAFEETVVRERIAVLASDEFEGRKPATRGGLRTREYLKEEMKRIGLLPANGDSFEQEVPLVEIALDAESSAFSLNGSELSYGVDIMFWTAHAQQQVSFVDSDLVFVGYGITAPEYGWDDYASVDVTGKTVIILVNDPGYASGDPSFFNGSSMTYYGRWTYKVEEAARQGAAAAIIIHQTEPASYNWQVVVNSWGGRRLHLKLPNQGADLALVEGWISEGFARELFFDAGLDFEEQLEAASKPGFNAVPMAGLRASSLINNNIRESVSANVAGTLPGAVRPDEYVIYMAHWDHLGNEFFDADDGDNIANGAVDNATGLASILSIAEAFAESPEPPHRSILFLAVTLEESGLLGSAYFAEDPLMPLGKIVGGINIDALFPVSETKDLVVIGSGASELEELLEASASRRDMYLTSDPNPQAGYFYRSDHFALAKRGVPMLYAKNGLDFVEGGMEAGKAFEKEYIEERYEQPGDEYDPGWEMEGIMQAVGVLYEVGGLMAYSDTWPNWYEGNEFRALRDEQLAKEAAAEE